MSLTQQDEQYLSALVMKAKQKVLQDYGLELDLNNVKVDTARTLEENKATIIQLIKTERDNKLKEKPEVTKKAVTLPKTTATKAVKIDKQQQELEKAKAEKARIEQQQKEETEIIQKWKQQFNPNMIIKSPAYYTMEKYIEMVCSKHINFCIIQSDGGLAKTWSSNAILQQKSNKYATYNSFTSPLEFYNFLYDNSDDVDILIDDCEGIWDSKAIISLLKNATELDGNRVISWNSTTSKLEGRNTKKVFTSRIILLTNVLPSKEKNSHIGALLSRALVERLNFSYQEKLDVILEVSKREYKSMTGEERQEVFEFLKRHSSPTTELSIRTLIKLYKFHLFAKEQGNKELFCKLGVGILKAPEHKEIVYQLVTKAEKSVKDQIEEYVAKTGRSRADFFRVKDELFPKDYKYQRVETTK